MNPTHDEAVRDAAFQQSLMNGARSRARPAAGGPVARRRFLGWAGGLALSPIVMALAACGSGTDAVTPPDGGSGDDGGLGDAPPPGEGCSKGWNAAAKSLVATTVAAAGNGIVPLLGSFAAGMINTFWPNCGTTAQDDVLSRADVTDIANKTNATEKLAYVQGSITTYQTALQDATTDAQRQQAFENCFNQIASQDNYFQGSGDEAALLPMFVLYGNLFLALAVDAQVNQQKWGYTNGSPYLDGIPQFLNRAIPYVNQIAEWSYQNMIATGAIDYHACEPFRTANTERTRLITDALDLVAQWPYYGTIAAGGANPSKLIAQREVFYGPYGTGDNSGIITLPMVGATASPTTMLITSGERLDAVQATYPSGTGPDGVTTTPKMGDNGGGPTQVNYANTIVGSIVWSGDIVNGIQFNYSNGDQTGRLGQVSGSPQEVNPDTSLMSSVFVNGVSSYYGSADTFVVGYMLDPSQLTGN